MVYSSSWLGRAPFTGKTRVRVPYRLQMAYKSRFKEISDIDFENAVASSLFMVDVLEKLGYSRTSGTMTKFIKKRIEDNNIDISHFLGKKTIRSSNGRKADWLLIRVQVPVGLQKCNEALKK